MQGGVGPWREVEGYKPELSSYSGVGLVRRVDPLVHLPPPARGGPLNAKSPLQSREGPVETFRLIRDAFLKANILGGHCGALRNTHTHTHTQSFEKARPICPNPGQTRRAPRVRVCRHCFEARSVMARRVAHHGGCVAAALFERECDRASAPGPYTDCGADDLIEYDEV